MPRHEHNDDDMRFDEPGGPGERDDDRMLERLREALASAPGSESVAEFAKAAFTFRTMDAELAALDDAELVASGVEVGVGRLRGEPRILTFRAGERWIEVEHIDGDLVGQVTPAATADLVVEGADGSCARTALDELGCFIVTLPTKAPVRLRLQGAGVQVDTEWAVFREAP